MTELLGARTAGSDTPRRGDPSVGDGSLLATEKMAFQANFRACRMDVGQQRLGRLVLELVLNQSVDRGPQCIVDLPHERRHVRHVDDARLTRGDDGHYVS